MPCGWEGNRSPASHWLCFTDFSGLSTYGLTAYDRDMSTPPTLLNGYGTHYRYIPRSSRERLYYAMCIFYCTRHADAGVSNPTTNIIQPATKGGICNVPISHRAAVNVCIFTARCYASAVLAMGLCPSVCLCLSQAGVLLKQQNIGSHKQHLTIPHPGSIVF